MKPDVMIVSGLSRSGSSLMMQMLQAAGIALLVDEHLRPGQHNPRGYYEYQLANVKETSVDSLYRASHEILAGLTELRDAVRSGAPLDSRFVVRSGRKPTTSRDQT